MRDTIRALFVWALPPVIAAGLVGCSSEATAPPKTTSSEGNSRKDNTPSQNAKPLAATAAWSEETLEDGEFTLEDGFRQLLLNDFEPFFAKPSAGGVEATWRSIHNAIVCSGKPKGYLFTKDKFQDFTLRLEFRFAPPADAAKVADFNPNTGVLVFITEPHKQWPKSLEVQGKFLELATIKPNGGATAVELSDDQTARESARKPFGEWNTLEIVAKDGALTTKLNGTKICESRPGDLSQGAIGLQSEDFEVHFRRIRIKADSPVLPF